MSRFSGNQQLKKQIKKRLRTTLRQRLALFKAYYLINHRFKRYVKRTLIGRFNRFASPLAFNPVFKHGFKTQIFHAPLLRGRFRGVVRTRARKFNRRVVRKAPAMRSLFSLFVSFFIKKGKNWRLYVELVNWMGKFCKLAKITRLSLLTYLFLRLNTKVEVRRLRIRRRTHFVPFFISLKRQLYLVLRWLLATIRGESKVLLSYAEKIFLEIRKVLFNKNSATVALVLKNNLLAYKNRSSAHFRW